MSWGARVAAEIALIDRLVGAVPDSVASDPATPAAAPPEAGGKR